MSKETKQHEERGISYDLIVGAAVAAPVVTPVVSQVTAHLLNRPKEEEPPPVVLPPGVHHPDE